MNGHWREIGCEFAAHVLGAAARAGHRFFTRALSISVVRTIDVCRWRHAAAAVKRQISTQSKRRGWAWLKVAAVVLIAMHRRPMRIKISRLERDGGVACTALGVAACAAPRFECHSVF